MFSLPNLLSLTRFPLAFLFLSDNLWMRSGAIFCAMLTDVMDGYLARRYRSVSQFGAIIDPLSDKFFVGFVLLILIHEQKIGYMDAFAMLSRDVSVFLFSFYLLCSGLLKAYHVQAIWSGKVATALQFLVLFSIVFALPIPTYAFPLFFFLGFSALAELAYRKIPSRSQSLKR